MTNVVLDFSILAGSRTLREFKAGEIIFKRGEAGHELFVVKSGQVEIRVGTRVLDTLSEYSIFGEMALIDSAPRSATAVAITDTTLISVSDEQLKPLISDFALTIMREMSGRLREHARRSELTNIDAITGSIVHEIRQPLAAIAMNSSAARRFLTVSPPDPQEAGAALDRIVAAVHRTSAVLDGIHALFRRSDQNRQRIDLSEIALEVLDSMAAELKAREVTCLPGLPKIPLIHGNKTQLRQVLLNIVRNAIEAMDAISEGHRVLRVITRAHGDDAVAVSVEDSGPGIDPEKIEGIFDAFVTTKPQGMGLGLAISRMIVEHHGGQLTAVSDGKSGALFQFILPTEANKVPPPGLGGFHR